MNRSGIEQARLPALLLGAGILLLAIYRSVPVEYAGAGIPGFLARYAAAYALYALALWWVQRSPAWRGLLPALFLFAALFRLALLPTTPGLSTDVYRYIWDGRVQAAGVNPYAHRVNDPALDPLATPTRAKVNHPFVTTPYLPVAQVAFAALYRLAPEQALPFQAAAALFDLLAGLLILGLLRALDLPPAPGLLLYLWNPLVVVESAGNAHLDALMTCLMLAALLLIARGRAAGGAVVLGLAALTKPLPLLLLAVIGRRLGLRRVLLAGLAVAAGIALYSSAGLLSVDGTGVLTSSVMYLSGWSFNGGIFHWLAAAIAAGMARPWADPLPQLAARLICLGGVAVGLFATWRELGRSPEMATRNAALLRAAVLPFTVYLLFASSVHPWYLLPVLALLPFSWHSGPRWRLHALGWLWFAAAAPLSYLAYTGNGSQPEWARLAAYLPLFALLGAATATGLPRFFRHPG